MAKLNKEASLKREVLLVLMSCLFVIFLSFILYKYPALGFITGSVVHEEDKGDLGFQEENDVDTTEAQALEEIKKSESIISATEEEGFSTVRMKDLLKNAELAFNLAKEKSILEGDSASFYRKKEAEKNLQFSDIDKVSFTDVRSFTEEIEKLSKAAIIILDRINAKNIYLSPSEESPVNEELTAKPKDAELAYSEERFYEAGVLLEELSDLEEKIREEETILKSLQENARNFIQRNWQIILVSLIFLGTSGFFAQKKVRKTLLARKIDKLKSERIALKDLIKKVQIGRFKTNKVSEFTYKTRMDKYSEKLTEIKESLPVLESRLKGKTKPKNLLDRSRKFFGKTFERPPSKKNKPKSLKTKNR
tara:strand:+ start:335 stop:1426 length:1092 start_codon:yes stop_codon:yes gene_type:complete